MGSSIYTSEQKMLIAKLIKARNEKNLSQEDVAAKLKRTQSYVSKLESGQRRIDIVLLKTLAKIYHKDLNYFIES